jgi:hypothetical protein
MNYLIGRWFNIILQELTCLLSRIQYGGQFTVEPLFTILQLWILHAKNSQWNKVLNNSWIILLIIDKSQMSSISGCHVLSRNCLPFRSTWVHSRFLVGVARSFVFCIIFCRSLSDLFLLAIILSVLLRITASSCLLMIRTVRETRRLLVGGIRVRQMLIITPLLQ